MAKLRTAKAGGKEVTKKTRKPSKKKLHSLVLEHRDNGRKLARSLLRRWRVRLVSDEIDSIVDLSLCEAALRFSPMKGASFMTFFYYHLRGQLVRTIESATAANIFVPSIDSIVEAEGFTSNVETLSYLESDIPFHRAVVETPEDLLLRKEEISKCRKACEVLDPLEKEIVLRSFGNDEALADVARKLSYSRCHISRVKRSALVKLKSALNVQIVNVEEEAPEVAVVAMKRRRGIKTRQVTAPIFRVAA